MCDS
jgi:hypothetical protein